MYSASDEDSGDELEEILFSDDVEKFHTYMGPIECGYTCNLDKFLQHSAYDCALHFIQGNLRYGPPNLSRAHLHPYNPHHPFLYEVICFMREPYVFHLLFTNCNAANQANQPYRDLLPLHFLLFYLWKPSSLSQRYSRRPLSYPIDHLFQPQFRSGLECALILARHTQSLDQVALGYVLNGEITPLAALLLVAPFTSGMFETLKRYTSMESIALQAIHSPRAAQPTCYAAALLYIFEKDGLRFTSEFIEERVVRVSKGGQSSEYPSIQKIKDIRHARRQFSKSSQMTSITKVMEMMCRDDDGVVHKRFAPDRKISFDHILDLLRFLLKESESEGNDDTFQLLQANLSLVSEKWLHKQGGLPGLISAIRTFCNNSDHEMEHFKSHDQVNLTYICLLHLVLTSLGKYDYLSKWSPNQSLVKLILLLFLQSELKPTLDCAQLVAERTNSVNGVAWKLVQQRELIQLAGLLLVAHKKAMEPFKSGDTIVKATSLENIVSQVFYGEFVTATVGAAGLFEIFGRAGDKLTRYYCSIRNDKEHDPIEVIVEVATIMQNAGIQVLSTDVDLTDIYSARSHPQMLKSICERLGIKIDDATQSSRNSPFCSIKSPGRGIRMRKRRLDSWERPKPVEEIFGEGIALLGLHADEV